MHPCNRLCLQANKVQFSHLSGNMSCSSSSDAQLVAKLCCGGCPKVDTAILSALAIYQ